MRVTAAVEDEVDDGDVTDDAVRCDPVDFASIRAAPTARRTVRASDSRCWQKAQRKGQPRLSLPADEALRLDDAGEGR